MIRVLLASLLVAALGGSAAFATGGSTLGGRMPGSGRCLLTSPETFLCDFSGTFTGRLDGVIRSGTWRVKFSVLERTLDYEVWNQPVAGFRLVLPAAAGQPRKVINATGAPGATVSAAGDGGFDLSIPLTSSGDQPEMTVVGRFGPSTGAARTRALLPARFRLSTAASARTARPALRHESAAFNASRGAIVFSGTGSGRGECAVMSTEVTACAWRGTFAGKFAGQDRSGKFALQVSLLRTTGGGAAPPPYNPKEIGIDKVVLQFSPTTTKPGRVFRIGPGGDGTVSMTPDASLAFESKTQPFADGLVLEFKGEARWGVEGLKATGNEVAIESLEIVHEGIGGTP